jgi:hypothetical protein
MPMEFTGAQCSRELLRLNAAEEYLILRVEWRHSFFGRAGASVHATLGVLVSITTSIPSETKPQTSVSLLFHKQDPKYPMSHLSYMDSRSNLLRPSVVSPVKLPLTCRSNPVTCARRIPWPGSPAAISVASQWSGALEKGSCPRTTT